MAYSSVPRVYSLPNNRQHNEEAHSRWRRKGCLRRIKTVGTFKVVRHFHLNEWNPSYQRKMNANGDLPSGQTLEAQSSDRQSRQPSPGRPNPRPTLLNFCSSSETVSAASSSSQVPVAASPSHALGVEAAAVGQLAASTASFAIRARLSDSTSSVDTEREESMLSVGRRRRKKKVVE